MNETSNKNIEDLNKNTTNSEQNLEVNSSESETQENPKDDIHVETSDNQADEVETASHKDALNEEEVLTEEEKLKKDLNAQKDKYVRLFAEFENYKRRTSKERMDLFKTAGQEVMQSLLPVLDDFDRALKEVRKSEDKDLIQGIELINNKLSETLKSKGLALMHVNAGDAFDADLHEAITQIPAPTEELKGKIVDVVEKGYTLGDKIIRFPKVVTGK